MSHDVDSPRWDYGVRVYGPRNQLLIETRHVGTASRDVEIDAALSRDDVSHAEWVDLRTPFTKPTTVYRRRP
jgi:hypothetical protein